MFGTASAHASRLHTSQTQVDKFDMGQAYALNS